MMGNTDDTIIRRQRAMGVVALAAATIKRREPGIGRRGRAW
jgi:hypothetical protein